MHLLLDVVEVSCCIYTKLKEMLYRTADAPMVMATSKKVQDARCWSYSVTTL